MARNMSASSMLGLFREPDKLADAMDRLRAAGFEDHELEVLTPCPYPEGAFGEPPPSNHLYVFPLIGAACGLAVGILLVVASELSFPVVTGGKPILSIPPILIILFEGLMLGAIIFTLLGFLFEARLPGVGRLPYDRRISDGYLGIAHLLPGAFPVESRAGHPGHPGAGPPALRRKLRHVPRGAGRRQRPGSALFRAARHQCGAGSPAQLQERPGAPLHRRSALLDRDQWPGQYAFFRTADERSPAMEPGALHTGGGSTPLNAGFGPIILIFLALVVMPMALVSQVAMQALATPRLLGQRWLARLVNALLALGWFGLLGSLLLIGLGAGAYGLYMDRFAGAW